MSATTPQQEEKEYEDAVAELNVRTPTGKEARKFSQAIRGVLIMLQQPGSETGEHGDRVISHWIEQLTDLSAEEVAELGPYEMSQYTDAFVGVLNKVMVKPSKKRSPRS